MGAPINTNYTPSPNTPSTLIVWQGPDIPCLGIKRDMVINSVICSIANTLCEVADKLNIDVYDFSCLLAPGEDAPESFEAMIQLLIDKVCSSGSGGSGSGSGGGSGGDVNVCDALSCTITLDCSSLTGYPTITDIPLYDPENPQTSALHIIYSIICDYNTKFQDVDNTLASLQSQINNLSSSGFTFPSFQINSCVYNMTSVSNDPNELIQAVQAIADKLCCISDFLGHTDGVCTLSGTVSCYFGFADSNYTVSFTNLVEFVNAVEGYVSEACGEFSNIGQEIYNLDGRVTALEGTVSNCGCDCKNAEGTDVTVVFDCSGNNYKVFAEIPSGYSLSGSIDYAIHIYKTSGVSYNYVQGTDTAFPFSITVPPYELTDPGFCDEMLLEAEVSFTLLDSNTGGSCNVTKKVKFMDKVNRGGSVKHLALFEQPINIR